MVRPDTTLESVVTALRESERLPDATTYSIYEVDSDGGQSNLRPPIVEITTVDVVRSNAHNTQQIGFATDNAGNHIGRIYEAEFEMPVEIDVWTAEGGQYDPHEIGESVRYALYQYDAQQRGDPLPDPDDPSTALDGVVRFTMNDGGVRNDLSMTPALRRWRQTGEVWFTETVNTAEEYGAEDYVANVVTPSGDDATGDGETIEFTTSS